MDWEPESKWGEQKYCDAVTEFNVIPLCRTMRTTRFYHWIIAIFSKILLGRSMYMYDAELRKRAKDWQITRRSSILR